MASVGMAMAPAGTLPRSTTFELYTTDPKNVENGRSRFSILYLMQITRGFGRATAADTLAGNDAAN